MVDRAAFDENYDRFIIGRQFVETDDYYIHSRERFWNAIRFFARLPRPAGPVLDIGGGQCAILCRELFGVDAFAADVNETAEPDIRAAGLGFQKLNLLDGLVGTLPADAPPEPRYAAITLLEVIEHLPVPGYLVLERLRRHLLPGGVLLLTTPNGYRLRNILYMLLNRRLLDHYRYPKPGENMGHQLEYTLPEMVWQAERAGFAVAFAEHYADGWAGSTPLRRAARTVARAADVVPHLRNGIVLGLRAPDDVAV